MATATAKKYSADIIIAAEPNVRVTKNNRWIKDQERNVAVYLRNRKTNVMGVKTKPGLVTLDMGRYHITCCYLSPNQHMEIFHESVGKVMSAVEPGAERIILGDVNAKSPRWGAPTWDTRGEELVENLESLDMIILSDGKTPTWGRGDQQSYIDITAATPNIANKISSWKVLDEESLSHHAFIMFDLEIRRKTPATEKTNPIVDKTALREILSRKIQGMTDTNPGIKELAEMLKNAQQEATITRRGEDVKLLYWWTVEIETARKACLSDSEGPRD